MCDDFLTLSERVDHERTLDGFAGCRYGSAFLRMQLASAAVPTVGNDQAAMQGPAGLIHGSTLIGATVLNPQGQRLGKIKDVLLDSQAGEATFVLLDAEAAGFARAMLVVPYQALWVGFNPLDHRQSVVLDLRPDQLHAAPQIQNDQWQMLQNPQFLDQARNFYQVRTYTTARPIDNTSATEHAGTVPRAPALRKLRQRIAAGLGRFLQ